MRVQARPSRLRCVWCLGSLEGAARKCPGCGVLVHALCAVEAGICPSLGCGYSVWHAPARRVRSSAAIRAEHALIAWGLATIVVWTTTAVAALRVAATHGVAYVVRQYVFEVNRSSYPVSEPEPTSYRVPDLAPASALSAAPVPATVSDPAPGQLTLRFADPIVRGSTHSYVQAQVIFENHGDTPVLVMRDTDDRRFARFQSTLLTAGGEPVAAKPFGWRCGSCLGWWVSLDDFVVVPPHGSRTLRASFSGFDYHGRSGLHRLRLRYKLDPKADKLDEETVPRTCQRGVWYDEAGTRALLAQTSPLDLTVDGELWVVLSDP